jgi:hypothetical protein
LVTIEHFFLTKHSQSGRVFANPDLRRPFPGVIAKKENKTLAQKETRGIKTVDQNNSRVR